jgi:hypothetical protein
MAPYQWRLDWGEGLESWDLPSQGIGRVGLQSTRWSTDLSSKAVPRYGACLSRARIWGAFLLVQLRVHEPRGILLEPHCQRADLPRLAMTYVKILPTRRGACGSCARPDDVEAWLHPFMALLRLAHAASSRRVKRVSHSHAPFPLALAAHTVPHLDSSRGQAWMNARHHGTATPHSERVRLRGLPNTFLPSMLASLTMLSRNNDMKPPTALNQVHPLLCPSSNAESSLTAQASAA